MIADAGKTEPEGEIVQAEKLPELSTREAAFVEHYLGNGYNATRAALDAGYAKSSSRVQGHRLITRDSIRAEIKAHLADLGVTHERVVTELAAIAYGSQSNGQLLRVADRQRALESLLTVLNRTGARGVSINSGGGPIQNNVGTDIAETLRRRIEAIGGDGYIGATDGDENVG